MLKNTTITQSTFDLNLDGAGTSGFTFKDNGKLTSVNAIGDAGNAWEITDNFATGSSNQNGESRYTYTSTRNLGTSIEIHAVNDIPEGHLIGFANYLQGGNNTDKVGYKSIINSGIFTKGIDLELFADDNNNSINGIVMNPILGGSRSNYTNGIDMTLYTYQQSGSVFGINILSQPGSFTDPSANNAAIKVHALTGGSSSTGNNYGVFSTATPNSKTSFNVALYGNASNSFTNSWAVFSDGDTYLATGYTPSDSVLKTNVNIIKNAGQILKQLKPKTYNFDQKVISTTNFVQDNKLHYGLYSEEVQRVLPDLVKGVHLPETVDSTGTVTKQAIDFMALNYTELIPFLIAGYNDLQTEVQNLKDSLALVNASIPIAPGGAPQRVTLSNNQGIILNQNDPNPFAESTLITYSIPENIHNAKLIFSDNKGIILREVVINEKGSGSIEIYGSELSSGIYTYTLMCDGKMVESKKMMKTK